MKKVIIVLIVLCSGTFLFSQETEQNDVKNLLIETIPADIESSDYFELIAWCERLELPVDGSTDTLKNRLYNHYNITPKKEGQIDSSGLQTISIESAENLEYFDIEKVDEDYVRITGNVKINIEKNGVNGKEIHEITANEILYNFKENFITATGNIEYRLKSEESDENFRGEKITFNINTTEGIFDEGITIQNKDIENKDIQKNYEIQFLFKGEEITKTSENYVLLENGEITSCDFQNPHYRIRAAKLWLLTDNEWAILNGILYIGRIPLLYIPAFLYTGNDLFFNPSFGYRTDSGYHLQTTTYFIGKKEKNDSAFSLLQPESESSYYKLNGLFLTEDDNPTENKIKITDYGNNGNYIKYIMDFYSTLGIYTALDAQLSDFKTLEPSLSFLKDTRFYLSAALSRYTEQNGNAVSVLFPDDNGQYSSIWLKSYLWNIQIPFRYGFDFASGFDFKWLTINYGMDLWSDNDYKTDFFNRSENLDLLSLVNLLSEGAEDTDTGTVSSSDVNINITVKPDTKTVTPYINNLQLNASSLLNFSSKDLVSEEFDAEDYVEDFFYPDNFIIPNISATVSGNILPLKREKEDAAKAEEEIELPDMLELKSPISDNSAVEQPSEFSKINLPEAKDDLDIELEKFWSDTKAFTNSLNYKFSPTYLDKTQLQTRDWAVPEDIMIDSIEYSYKNFSVDYSLSYKAEIFENLFTLSNTIAFDYDSSEHYNMELLPEATIEQYRQEDLLADEFFINNKLSLNSNPLKFSDILTDTKLTYSLNSILYRYDYSVDDELFKSEVFRKNSDFISEHSLSVNLPLKTSIGTQTMNLKGQLPPLDFGASGELNCSMGIFSASVKTSIDEEDEDFIFNPLQLSTNINFNNILKLSDSVSYNFEEQYFEQNIFSASIFFLENNIKTDTKLIYKFQDSSFQEFQVNTDIYNFYVDFKANNTFDYNYDEINGWVKDDETSFIASDLVSGFKFDTDNYKIWRNRIDLKLSADSRLDFDLIRFTESSFTFTFAMNFSIFQFLDFEMKTSSENLSLYRYFPSYCDELGISNINLFEDLLKSFNFFNENDRYQSNFNLKSITLSLIHDLHDWDLKIDYTGRPFVNDEDGYPFYDWQNKLSIYMAWKAIPDIKTEMEIDNEEVSF